MDGNAIAIPAHEYLAEDAPPLGLPAPTTSTRIRAV
jgi:hypothetical protein